MLSQRFDPQHLGGRIPSWEQWQTTIMPAFQRLKQSQELETSLVYVSSPFLASLSPVPSVCLPGASVQKLPSCCTLRALLSMSLVLLEHSPSQSVPCLAFPSLHLRPLEVRLFPMLVSLAVGFWAKDFTLPCFRLLETSWITLHPLLKTECELADSKQVQACEF